MGHCISRKDTALIKRSHIKFLVLTIEKAVTELKKLARETASGVRCVIKRRGITG